MHTVESLAKQLRNYRLKLPIEHRSTRKFAALVGMDYSLIGKFESGKKVPGPEPLTKLANALKLTGEKRDLFFRAGTEQSKRCAQAFTNDFSNPIFRSVLIDLLKALKIQGDALAFNVPTNPGKHNFDLAIIMSDGRHLGLEFKTGKIIIAVANSITGEFPDRDERSILNGGGYVAEITIKGGARNP